MSFTHESEPRRKGEALSSRLHLGLCVKQGATNELHSPCTPTCCFSSAVAKDDITKELITSNGKARAYYLYVPSTVKSTQRR